MSIVDGEGLVTWEGGMFEPGSDLLHRVQWAFAAIRADGGTIILNEAGRPFGVPGDMNVRNAWQTASGVSTVWFQWGRYRRGETPSAANPNSGALASEHTQGKAVDCNAPTVFDATLRAKYFHMVGMVQTISSESWHWAIRGPVQAGINLAAATAVPIVNEPQGDEIDMASISDIGKELADQLGPIVADLKSAIRREERGRLYYCSTPPAGLPQFVCIFWDRDPVDGRNILYANAGETQVRNWMEVYYQTSDTVEQAKKAEMRPDKYAALIEFAKGNDSAFTNNLAAK